MGSTFRRILTVAAAFVCQPTPAPAQGQPIVLQPLGAWQTEQLDDRCIVRRAFGDASRPTVIELRRIDPWDGGFHAAVTSAQFALAHEPFEAAWLPNGRLSNIDLPSYTRDHEGREWVEFQNGLWDGALDAALERGGTAAYFRDGGPERFKRQVETFDITGAFDQPVSLRTGAMDAAVTAADECMKAMLAARGVDPRDMARSDSRAVPRHLPPRPRIFSRLPDAIGTRARPSMVDFLLYLDAKGRPTSCRLSSLPRDDAFEAWGCEQFMKHASFGFAPGEPAQPTFFKVSMLHRP